MYRFSAYSACSTLSDMVRGACILSNIFHGHSVLHGRVQENSPLLLLDLVHHAIDSHHKPSNDLFGNVVDVHKFSKMQLNCNAKQGLKTVYIYIPACFVCLG